MRWGIFGVFGGGWGIIWVGVNGWENILAGQEWVGVYGALFWVGRGRWEKTFWVGGGGWRWVRVGALFNNDQIKQWRNGGTFWTNARLNSMSTVYARTKYFKCFPSIILIQMFLIEVFIAKLVSHFKFYRQLTMSKQHAANFSNTHKM